MPLDSFPPGLEEGSGIVVSSNTDRGLFQRPSVPCLILCHLLRLLIQQQFFSNRLARGSLTEQWDGPLIYPSGLQLLLLPFQGLTRPSKEELVPLSDLVAYSLGCVSQSLVQLLDNQESSVENSSYQSILSRCCSAPLLLVELLAAPGLKLGGTPPISQKETFLPGFSRRNSPFPSPVVVLPYLKAALLPCPYMRGSLNETGLEGRKYRTLRLEKGSASPIQLKKESHLSSNRTGSLKSVACPSRALPIA